MESLLRKIIAKFHGIEINSWQNSMPGFTFVNNNHLLLSTFSHKRCLKRFFSKYNCYND